MKEFYSIFSVILNIISDPIFNRLDLDYFDSEKEDMVFNENYFQTEELALDFIKLNIDKIPDLRRCNLTILKFYKF